MTGMPPPATKHIAIDFQGLKVASCYKISALALLIFGLLGAQNSCLAAQEFNLSNDNQSHVINKKYLYLITNKNDSLKSNSLTGKGWESGDIKYLRLVSINSNRSTSYGDYGGDGSRTPLEGVAIDGNVATLTNVTGLSEFNHIYVTALKDSTIQDNEVKVVDSSIDYFRPIWITEIASQTRPLPEGNLPAIGSSNLIVTSNHINAVNLTTKNLFAAIVVSNAEKTKILSNEILVSGGTHNTVTGISTAKGTDYQIAENKITVNEAAFTQLHAVDESAGANATGEIRSNHLTLSGLNTLLSKNVEVSIAAVCSSSSNINSTLTITGTLDIQNKFYDSSIYAGHSDWGDVSKAVLTVYGGTIQGVSNRAVELVAGHASGESTDNHLIWKNKSDISGVDSGSNFSYLIGGKSTGDVASDNSVEISDSVWRAGNFTMANLSNIVVNPKNQLAGSAIVGAWGATEAKNNSISIVGSEVKATDIVGSITNSGDMSSNVTIENSTVEGSVQLFYSDGNGMGSDSTLTVTGAKTDLSNARLLTTTSESVETRNNTLVIDGWTGTVGGLGVVLNDGQKKTFDNLQFTNMIWQDGGTILTSNTVHVKDGGTDTVINADSFKDGSLQFSQAPSMESDESMTIIHADNGITYTDDSAVNTDKALKGNAGTSLEFDGTLTFGETDISYTVKGINNSSQTILVGDSRLAAAAFVNQGSDLLERVFHGFTLSRDKYGLMTFATAEGTKSNYDLSSPIKINGWNFLGGARYVAPTDYGDLTSALFVEYGDGNYRARNSHLGLDFRTDGSMQYVGGGVAMRLMTPANFYAEGSIRAGELRSNLDRALMDANGSFYDADTTSLYAGLHLGAGYIFKPAANLELDSYAKYFFTYTDSDSFRIEQYNETYEFESIASHRLRLGTRLSTKQSNMTFMLGLAGEYEFAGESDMVVANAATETSDLGGFSAFAEAGLSIKPSAGSPWQFDAQVRGWEGTREAVSGMVTVNYLF